MFRTTLSTTSLNDSVFKPCHSRMLPATAAGTMYSKSDNDLDDTFASKIEGLVFSEETIRLQNVTIHGSVISNHDVKIQDGLR